LHLLSGAAVGFERQWRQRLAGLRTNTLVALGAASFTVFAASFPDEVSPTRVAAQVVSGIGFLGAGIIFREGFNIRGLNTAATLWCSAAIGVFAGAGALILAAVATAIIIGVNLGLRPLVRLIDRQPNAGAEVDRHYLVTLTCKSSKEAHIRALLLQAVAAADVKLQRLESSDEPGSAEAPAERVTVTADLIASGPSETWLEATVGRLCLEPSVTRAGWSEVKTA
jgi:Uncharacterized membrane protein